MKNEGKNRSAFIFGLILIGIGLIFLLNTLGIATFRLWYFLSRFWPVLLILFGLNLILKKSKLWWIIPLLIFFIFIGAIIMPNSILRRFDDGLFIYRSSNDKTLNVYQEDRQFDQDLEKLKIDLLYGANRLNINTLNSKNDLFDLRLTYNNERPDLSYQKVNNIGYMKVMQNKTVNIGLDPENWSIDLTKEIPLDISIKAGAGDIWLDLKELKVDNLNIEAGVGQLNITYPNYSSQTEIKAAAGNIKLNIPENAGLRIESKTVINNNNFESIGLIKLYKDVYQSKNYGDVENKINIKISTSASNINLNIIR